MPAPFFLPSNPVKNTPQVNAASNDSVHPIADMFPLWLGSVPLAGNDGGRARPNQAGRLAFSCRRTGTTDINELTRNILHKKGLYQRVRDTCRCRRRDHEIRYQDEQEDEGDHDSKGNGKDCSQGTDLVQLANPKDAKHE